MDYKQTLFEITFIIFLIIFGIFLYKYIPIALEKEKKFDTIRIKNHIEKMENNSIDIT
jgi:hypothetical protein